MDPLGIWNGLTTNVLINRRKTRQSSRAREIRPPGSPSVILDTNAKRDRPSTAPGAGREERSRSVVG
jgi:hypothetical protein